MKISILGSTGSIGKTLLNIIEKDKKNIEVFLLTANKDYLTLLNQAKKFKTKNLIITDKKSYEILKEKTKRLNINVFNDFKNLKKIFKKNKIDYTMSAITGLDGLRPTFKMIKFTRRIAIANKESIICAWSIIKEELKINKTLFIPVDSEHFSIWHSLKNKSNKKIDKIFLTASGGPLLNIALKNFKNIKISQALKHPNWKMGKKISIDSATMMNKVFEVIEANKIFEISYKKISILTQPSSYIHALIKFDNGMTDIIAHDTTMKIPIFNTLYFDTENKLKTKNISINKLNNLNLNLIDIKRFPSVKIIDLLIDKETLFETVIVSANDQLVNLFLENKIRFIDISRILINFLKKKEFLKYKKIKPISIESIENLSKDVRLKITSLSV
jgi:1-deoxy-D-xylulose-5-phosphate reductoisomerase